MNPIKIVLIIIGIVCILSGASLSIMGTIGAGAAKNAIDNNSSGGQKKLGKNNKCLQITGNTTMAKLNDPKSILETGNFCNANTPSTWQNNKDFAKNFYPADMKDQKALYKDNTNPSPFYSSGYGERERQVESAQLLGKFQGKASSYVHFGSTLGGLGVILVILGVIPM